MMKPVLIVLLSFVLCASTAYCVSDLVQVSSNIISAQRIRGLSRDAMLKKMHFMPPEYASAMHNAKAGDPILVQRLDRHNDFYYIVPFEKAGAVTLLVIIDAVSGKYREAVPVRDSKAYTFIHAEQARKILLHSLQDPKLQRVAQQIDPKLVWKPCEQSQSMFEPLWFFSAQGGNWFIDQRGRLHTQLSAPPMKGGFMPGSQ